MRTRHLEPFPASPVPLVTGSPVTRQRIPRAPTRTLAQFEQSQHLELAIAEALAARPIDESMLRVSIYHYVSEEGHAGTSAGRITVALADMVEQSKVALTTEQQAVTRRVILWCVEAYFGSLGGPVEAPIAAPGRRTDSAIVASGESL